MARLKFFLIGHKRKELTPKFPTGIATPLQYSVNKEIKDIYLGLAESYDSPDYEQKKIEAMYRIGVITEEAKNLTNDYNAAYKFHEENKGEQKFSDSYGESALYGTSIDENPDATYEEVAENMRKNIGDMQQHYTPKGFTQIATTLKPQVSVMSDKGKVSYPLKDGTIITTDTEKFTKNEANDLIFRNISQATNANDWLQSGLAAMSDDQKKAYGTDLNGVAQWWADENDEKFVIDVTKGTRTKPVPDKEDKDKGYSSVASFNVDERPMNIISPEEVEGGFFSLGDTEVEGQPTKVPIRGAVNSVRPVVIDITKGSMFKSLSPVEKGETWEDGLSNVSVGVDKLLLEGINIVPFFKKGVLGEKKQTKIGGRLVSESLLDNPYYKDKIEWKPAAIFVNEYVDEGTPERNIYTPLSNVKSEVKKGFGKHWDAIETDLYGQVDKLNNKSGGEPTSGGTTTGGGASKFNK
jgi:hypothetical protein